MTLRSLLAGCAFVLLLAACGRAPEPPAATAPAATAAEPVASARPAIVIAPASPAASAPVNGGLTSGVYVWQRAWMPANLTALSDSRTIFSELRVLAAQQQPGEGWIDARVDLDGLKQDGRDDATGDPPRWPPGRPSTRMRSPRVRTIWSLPGALPACRWTASRSISTARRRRSPITQRCSPRSSRNCPPMRPCRSPRCLHGSVRRGWAMYSRSPTSLSSRCMR